MPRATASPANAPNGSAMGTSADAGGRVAFDERPIVLLKIEASLNATAVNLSFLSPTSSDVYCLPPGAYFEQRKTANEEVPFGSQGEPLQVKVIDVVLHLPPALAKQAAALADARVEVKAAREGAQ